MIRDADDLMDQDCPVPIGTRIRLIEMPNDPDPVPAGSTGTVTSGNGFQMSIDWDNGRGLNLIPTVDKWEVVDD